MLIPHSRRAAPDVKNVKSVADIRLLAGFRVGWGGRIRTSEYGIQSPAPYRLATPQALRPVATLAAASPAATSVGPATVRVTQVRQGRPARPA